jgi:hypothetical protein
MCGTAQGSRGRDGCLDGPRPAAACKVRVAAAVAEIVVDYDYGNRRYQVYLSMT